MAKYGNENAAAGGRNKDTASRDRDYGGGPSRGGGGSGNGGGRRAGSATVADHMVATGRTSAPSIPAGGVARGNYATQDDAYNDFAKAIGKHATRGFFDRALDRLLGGLYDPQEPMAGNPRSFAEGDFHSTTNPGSVIGGILGMGMGPAGMLAGPVMGSAWSGLGLPEVWHGGYDQPDLRGGLLGNTDAPMGATMADIGSGHTLGGDSGLAGVNAPLAGGGTGNNTQMAGIPNGPMAPQPGAVTPATPAGPMAPPAMANVPGAWLGVPGPTPYGLMMPGYQWAG